MANTTIFSGRHRGVDIYLNPGCPTVNAGCNLSREQQRLALENFSPKQGGQDPKVPIIESIMTQYHFAPDITRMTTPFNVRYGSTEGLYTRDDVMNLKDTFEMMQSPDGVIGKVENYLELHDIHNNIDIVDPLEIMIDFVQSTGIKQPNQLKSFKKLFERISDEVTSLHILQGTFEDTANEKKSVSAPFFIVYAFAGDNYLMTYSSTPYKNETFRTRASCSVTYANRLGRIRTSKIPLTKISKASSREIENYAESRAITVPSRYNKALNNMQEDCYEVTNIRALAGVI